VDGRRGEGIAGAVQGKYGRPVWLQLDWYGLLHPPRVPRRRAGARGLVVAELFIGD
jgi:hypothetical protein